MPQESDPNRVALGSTITVVKPTPLEQKSEPAQAAATGALWSDTVSAGQIEDLSSDPNLHNVPRMSFNGVNVPALGGNPLLRCLGKGGMGWVYLGFNPRLEKLVAVKALPPKLALESPPFVKRFMEEARAAAQVKSEHLIVIHDINSEPASNGPNISYLVMEYIKGKSARQYLDETKASGMQGAAESDALALCIAACKGLAAAHSKGVVHRDVKPANIMIPQEDESGRLGLNNAIIVDLGVARRVRTALEKVTGTGDLLGTLGYAAPEQINNAQTADARADVFSMGATLYDLLTGDPPFKGTGYEIIYETMTRRQNPIRVKRPEISEMTQSVIEICLAKEAAKRYADANELLRELLDCQDALAPKRLSLRPDSPRPGAPGDEESRQLQEMREALSHAVTMALGYRAEKNWAEVVDALQELGAHPANADHPSRKIIAKLLAEAHAELKNLAAVAEKAERERQAAQAAAEFRRAAAEVAERQRVSSAQTADERKRAAEGQVERDRLAAAAEAERQRLAAEQAERERVEKEAAAHRERLAAIAKQNEPPKAIAFDLGGGVRLDLVLIPAGTFGMGSPEGEEGRSDNERLHTVTITKPFYMAKYLVTQEQYQAVMGANPSGFKGPKNPVEQISWDDAAMFCELMSKKTGRTFQLPTEAQWEYACRAKTKTRFYSGELDRDLDGVGWYSTNSAGETHPVGEKAANAFGLYDMHGNVWEWCRDAYKKEYESLPNNDPYNTNAQSASFVVRSGSWTSGPRYCRSSYRGYGSRGSRVELIGFRVVAKQSDRSKPSIWA